MHIYRLDIYIIYIYIYIYIYSIYIAFLGREQAIYGLKT